MIGDFVGQVFSSVVPITVLLLFVLFFVGMLFWTLNRKRDKHFNEASQLPLNDGENSRDNRKVKEIRHER